MTFSELLRDTFRTLWAHKLHTFLTMFGITWGIISITLMVAAGEGLRVGQQKAAVGSLPMLGVLFNDTSGKNDTHLHISLGTVTLSTLVLLPVGVISGMVPAIRAARLNPVEALRYE